jgi:hypothetical protein
MVQVLLRISENAANAVANKGETFLHLLAQSSEGDWNQLDKILRKLKEVSMK